MATTYEELKLAVTLDDQATPKLGQNLKTHLSGFETFKKSFKEAFDAKQVEAYNRAQGETVETGKKLSAVNGEVREKAIGAAQAISGVHEMFLKAQLSGAGVVNVVSGVNKGLEGMHANFGKVGLAIGGVAIGMVAALAIGERFAKMLSNYAQTSVQRQRAAATIGIPSAQLKLYEQAYEAHGFTKEQAREDVATAAEKAHELRRRGFSEFRAELTKGQPTPECERAAAEGVARLTQAEQQGTPAYIRQALREAEGAGEQRRRELAINPEGLSPAAIEEEVATAVTKMMVVLTGSTRFGEARAQDVRTATPEDIKRQIAADKQAEEHFLAMQKIWVAYGTATDKLSESLTDVAVKISGPISERFKTWADSLKPEDFQRFADTLNEAVAALGQIDFKAGIHDLVGGLEHAREIAEGIRLALETGRLAAPLAKQAVGLAVSPEEKAALDQLQSDKAAQAARVAATERRETAEAQTQQGYGYGAGYGGGAIPSGVTAPMPQPIRPPTSAFSDFFDIGPFKSVPGAVNRTIDASVSGINEAVDASVGGVNTAIDSVTDLIIKQATKLGPMYDPTGPGKEGALRGVGPTPDFGALIRFIGDSLIGSAHADELGDQTKATVDLTDQLKTVNDTLENPSEMAAKLGYRDIGNRDAPALGEQTERIQKRLRWMNQADEGPPEPRSYPQHSSWRDWTAPVPETIDRQALYNAARSEMTHKIEGGAASLTVDVNAPAGTFVNADADERFHPVIINRQVQMEPAASTRGRNV